MSEIRSLLKDNTPRTRSADTLIVEGGDFTNRRVKRGLVESSKTKSRGTSPYTLPKGKPFRKQKMDGTDITKRSDKTPRSPGKPILKDSGGGTVRSDTDPGGVGGG